MNEQMSPFTLSIATVIEKHVDEMTVNEMRRMVDNLDMTVTDLFDVMGGRINIDAYQIDGFADHFGMSPYDLIEEAGRKKVRRDPDVTRELAERDV